MLSFRLIEILHYLCSDEEDFSYPPVVDAHGGASCTAGG